MAKTTLKVTSAFMLAGRMRTPGNIVRADDRTARDLIRRGKAEAATSEVAAELTDEDDDTTAAEQPAKGSAKKGGAGEAKADAAGDT